MAAWKRRGNRVARFIHTGDWHLGRLLSGMRLTDDQAFALDGLVDLVRDVRPDAVLVAGDLYDRAVPPPEAVTLLDETLTKLAETGTAVIIIAGNHDSPERVGFGSRLLARAGVHVAGPVSAEPQSVLLDCDDGPVRVWTQPYANPAVVRSVLADDGLRGHDEAVGALLDRVRGSFVAGERNVLVGHEFVAGGIETADSERPLTVGGTAQVALERFAGFNYVALGHLHRPQAVGTDVVRYAGSLLKYSTAETDHVKSVSLVEIDGQASARVRQMSLPVRRDVRTVSGALAELVASAPAEGRDDYVFAVLSDTGPLYDPMGELRSVYPNCIGFVRERTYDPSAGRELPDVASLRALDMSTLFAHFYESATGLELSDEQAVEFATVAGAEQAAEREA